MEMKHSADSLYDSLLEILSREIEIYRQIREVMRDEKKILMKPSLEGLHESNARKETWILKAKLLEEVRDNIVRRIAGVLGIAVEDVTLSVLVSKTEGNRNKILKECQSELNSLFREIRDLNEGNRALISTSLLFLRNSVEFMNDLMSPRAGYMDTGKMKVLNRNGKMLSVEG